MPETESVVFQRKVSELAPMLTSAKGLYINYEDPHTKEQHKVLDAMTGAAVGSLGHGDPEIVQAMKDAAETSNYSFGIYFGNYASEELGRFVIDHSPKDHFATCMWVGSGSEANDNALKILKQYFIEKDGEDTKRHKYISRSNAYHGFGIGSLSIGDGSRKAGYESILLPAEQTPKISCVDTYIGTKNGVTESEYTKKLLDELEETFIKNDPETIAGVVLETVCGSTMGTPPPPYLDESTNYLDGVKAICRKYGALFMLDEVMVGLGRVGEKYHAYTKFMKPGSGPDIMTIGKTIGSGFVTIAGVLISPKIKDVIVAGSDSLPGAQTYHFHEFNCKVALAVQKKIFRDDLLKKGGEAGQYMMNQLKEQLKDSKIVGEVRGLPLFHSIEFCNPETREPFDLDLKVCYRVQEKALANGITSMGFQGTCGAKTDEKTGETSYIGDHISIAPAYILTKDDADIIVNALADAVKTVEKEIYPDA